MGAAIGGKYRAATLAGLTDRDKRVVAEARQDGRVPSRGRAVVAEKLRPLRQPGQHRVCRLGDRRRDPLGLFVPVVGRKEFDGKHILDGAALVIALGLDALKGEIPPTIRRPPPPMTKSRMRCRRLGDGSDRMETRSGRSSVLAPMSLRTTTSNLSKTSHE